MPKATPKVEELFSAALELEGSEARSAFLDRVCGDLELRRRIEKLLEAAPDADDFLEAPASKPSMTIDHDSLLDIEEPGTSIGPYKLMERIGEGGMGLVYVAEQVEPVRRKVALKIIKPGMDSRQVIARFEAERQALAMMDHPNIAKVHDGGTTPSGRPYFVMELVRGVPITEYCDDQKLSIRERLELFVLVCHAVRHAHQKGIIHRDLKPSNILVTAIDGEAVPKIIDFGIAKATGQSLTDKTVYTAFAQLIGTPLYMSPEQVEMSGLNVDTRSDIYSLGVLLYELLTGTQPFDAETFRNAAFDEMRRVIREDEPPRPSTRLSSLGATLTTVSSRRKADPRRLAPSLRGELDWIVMKSLEKDRHRRYETANDFAADVTRYLTDQSVQACPPSAGYRLRKFVRRNKGPVAAGLALGVLLVLGTLGTSIGMLRALQAEAKAVNAADRALAAEGLAKDRLQEISKEKDRATSAEKQAKEDAATAEAVTDFLQKDLLAQADPEQNARAKKMTVEELLERASARIEHKFAQQPLVEAKVRQAIGNAYRELSNYVAARPHLERARALTATRPEDDPDVLAILSDLGQLDLSQDRANDAEQLFEKVLKIRLGKLGEHNPDTIDSMLDLAQAYGAVSRDADAESLLLKTLKISRDLLGDKASQTLQAMNNLAVHYSNQGRSDDAIPLLEQVLTVQLETDGEDHIHTLIAMANLGEMYSIRHHPEATKMLARTLEISRRVLGENHESTLLRESTLAQAHWFAKELDRAIAMYEEVVPKLKAHLAPYHYGTSRAMADLGWAYKDAGRLSDAIAMLEQAWEIDRKRPGTTVDPTSSTPILLAGLYEQTRQFHRAEALYREVIEAARNDPSISIARTSNLVSLLGGTLIKQMKFVEAESLLLANHEQIKQHEGKVPPNILKFRLIQAIERLVQLYGAWDRPAKASEWNARLGIFDMPADVFDRP